MKPTLNFLCAGAAQGLMKALQPGFEAAHGVTLTGRFGPVGALKEALFAGEPCDLMVVSDVMVDALVVDARLRADARAPLGRVRTGVAVAAGVALPDVSTPQALEAALRAADAIYFPDPERATAGIHFAAVMQQLGLLELLRPRFHTHPSGAVAMRELAAAGARGEARAAIGCTQITEIRYTEGVVLVGPLPTRFELATTYTAAVSTSAQQPALAEALLALLVSDASRERRQAGGFEA